MARDGVGAAALSRLLARNPAWMQQYLKRGTPRMLAEGDRGRLARFFGVAEEELGGPPAAVVHVRRLDLAASAGPGRLVDAERGGTAPYPAGDIAATGAPARDLSEIAVTGASMEPTLVDGDRILVDRGQRRPGARDAIWVIRTGDDLRVKRLARDGDAWRILSDNAPEERCALAELEVIGRVVRLSRLL